MPAHATDKAALAQQACAHMMARMDQKLTIVQIARACNVSATVLKEAFAETYGTSIYQWFRAWRMDQAARLLEATTMPISEVARTVGYQSHSKFSHAFVDCKQMLPSEWRYRFTKS